MQVFKILCAIVLTVASADARAVCTAIAGQSTATIASAASAGVGFPITVQGRDGVGDPVTTGSCTVVITISGANTANPFVTDELDGTYTASYTPGAAGGDSVVITLDGGAISGSPFSVTVAAGALSSSTSEATIPATGTLGVATNIDILAKDALGNVRTAGGDELSFDVLVNGVNFATPSVTDLSNGNYRASYTPTNVGSDTISVKVAFDGSHVINSPDLSGVVVPAELLSFDID